jgi:hypothetical protein
VRHVQSAEAYPRPCSSVFHLRLRYSLPRPYRATGWRHGGRCYGRLPHARRRTTSAAREKRFPRMKRNRLSSCKFFRFIASSLPARY